MEGLILTEEEKALVLRLRSKEAEKKAKRAALRHLLHVAAEYDAWLHDRGRGSNFGTFINEFCQGRPVDLGIDDGVDKAFFDRIESIREHARGLLA